VASLQDLSTPAAAKLHVSLSYIDLVHARNLKINEDQARIQEFLVGDDMDEEK
jgi:hypothetical protein